MYIVPAHSRHWHFAPIGELPAPIPLRSHHHCLFVSDSIRSIHTLLRHNCSHGENTARPASNREATRLAPLCNRARDNSLPAYTHAPQRVCTISQPAVHRDVPRKNCPHKLLLRKAPTLPPYEPNQSSRRVSPRRDARNSTAPNPIGRLHHPVRHVVSTIRIGFPSCRY